MTQCGPLQNAESHKAGGKWKEGEKGEKREREKGEKEERGFGNETKEEEEEERLAAQ